METNEIYNVVFPADAEIPTVKLNPIENMLGRWVKIPIALTSEEIVAPNGTQDLLADMYWELYKTYPLEKENIPDVRKVNKAILDMVKESQDWAKLRTQTTASVSMSKLCASGLLLNLLQDEEIQDALKKQEQAKDLEEQSDEQQQGDQQQEQKQEQGDKSQNKAKAKQLIQEALDSLGQPGQGNGSDNRNKSNSPQAVAKAVKDTKQDSDTARALAKTWGMEDGESGEIDPGEVLKMLEFYKRNAQVRKVTGYMGRVKGIAMTTREQYSKIKGVKISRDGYTQNLQRMFPAEMALLRKDVNALLRAQKASEYCDRGLLGMIEESQATEQGPLVVAVDESGSMSNDGILRAKGLALGICQSALENGQPFTVFGFSNRALREEKVTSEDPKTKLAGWATRYNGGGTSFNDALLYAIEVIEGGENKMTSDIVIITDGESEIGDTVKEKYLETVNLYGTRLICFGVDVENATNSGYRQDENHLFTLADAYINVDSLDDLNKLSEILTEKLIERERKV